MKRSVKWVGCEWRVDRWITWSWWGEGGERRAEISLAEVEVIGQMGSIEIEIEECQLSTTQHSVNREGYKRDGASGNK